MDPIKIYRKISYVDDAFTLFEGWRLRLSNEIVDPFAICMQISESFACLSRHTYYDNFILHNLFPINLHTSDGCLCRYSDLKNNRQVIS